MCTSRKAFLARGVDADSIMQWLVEYISLEGADENDEVSMAESIELAGLSFQLLSHHQLSWPYFFSFLPSLLSATQAGIIRATRASIEDTSTFARHALHFLAGVWSRGFQFFLFHANGTEQTQSQSGEMETRVVQLYQQCVNMIARIEWNSKLLLSTASEQMHASIATVYKYAMHLIQLCPHSRLFHRFITRVNMAGLPPLVDGAPGCCTSFMLDHQAASPSLHPSSRWFCSQL
jgi:hypothetical protein